MLLKRLKLRRQQVFGRLIEVGTSRCLHHFLILTAKEYQTPLKKIMTYARPNSCCTWAGQLKWAFSNPPVTQQALGLTGEHLVSVAVVPMHGIFIDGSSVIMKNLKIIRTTSVPKKWIKAIMMMAYWMHAPMIECIDLHISEIFLNLTSHFGLICQRLSILNLSNIIQGGFKVRSGGLSN